jgi:antirestriction protein ArdC
MDAYQMVTDRICELLEQGFIPWDKPWAMADTCAWSGHDGHAYTLLNQFLLADPQKKYKSWEELVDDIAGEWVTFKQAEARGGRIRKGEHGRKIVFFKMIPVKDEDGNETEKMRPLLSWSVVFKLSQCEGIEQKFHKDAGTLYDFDHNQTADEIADDYLKREGVTLKLRKGNRAYYRPQTDTVTLPLPEQFQNNAEYYSTLFHELTHSTGHPKRLNRLEKKAAFGDNEYSAEELVAEIGSASIMATLGIENDGTFRNNVAYIQNWLKALKNDKKLIVTASAKAEKAIKLILNIKEQKNGREKKTEVGV